MSQKSLFETASQKYDLKGAELYALGSVRRGGKIPPMWNVPLVIYQNTLVHRMLIVIMPTHLGLFSPSVLGGKAEPGGLESLDRGAKTKVAVSIPLSELSTLSTLRIVGVEARGSVIALHHSSGKDFVVNSLSPQLAQRIRRAVG
jgi:hypothetical protein